MAIKRPKSLMPIDTGDWLNDPRINNLSYDVRGVWITMLCLMWDSPTRGIMANANGIPYQKNQIIRLLGIDPATLDILVESGLLACRADGVFFSHEMVKREQISNARRNAGKKGGEVTKAKSITPKSDEVEQDAPMIEPPPEKPKEPTPAPSLFTDDDAPISPPELTPEQKAKADKKIKYKYAEFVTLTRDEYAKLCAQHGEDAVKRMIEILNNFKGQNGRRYKSDYYAIQRWVVNAYNDELLRYGNNSRQYNAPTSKSAGGVAVAPGYATGAIPTATRASSQSGDAPEKEYSERF